MNLTPVVSNPVEELLSRPIPERLWHYTSFEGFKGIVGFHRMWATDVRFLNDESELIHAQSIAKSVVEAMEDTPDNSFAKDVARDMVTRFWDTGHLSQNRIEVYTISFTRLDDTLSQWRGYGKGTTGISLGFDLHELRPAPEIPTLVTFAPCVYEETKKRELISFALSHFVDDVTSLWKMTVDPPWVEARLQEWNNLDAKQRASFGDSIQEWNIAYFRSRLSEKYRETVIDLVRLASLCKHKSFYEEQEWRLTLPVETGRVLQTVSKKERLRDGKMVPYLEVPAHNSVILPIKEVVIGPGKNNADKMSLIQEILKTAGYEVPVRLTDSPFIP